MKTCIAVVIALACVYNKIVVQADRGQLYQTSKNVTYFINQDYAYTWYEAFLECSFRNMTLLSLERDEKIDELLQVINKHKFSKKPPHLWTGGIGSNRKFVWSNTGRPIVSRLWGPGNPDNSANMENCVQIYENTKHLNDIKCVEKFGFVCEMTQCNLDVAKACDPEKTESRRIEKYSGFVFNFNQGK
ncbi:lectin subunit alpha [Stomoxys calcitrans]|uniref:lectin subunit alpha n=1 Tax=Stomoxys calcitrans TaxID=35570 RepID=UPI0027E284FE|nr:lectin subunit alpha [Stomoxys calcitrans]